MYTPGCSWLMPGCKSLGFEGTLHLVPCLEGIRLTEVWLEKPKYRCLGLPVVSDRLQWGQFMAGSAIGLTWGWLVWGSAASPSTAWGKAKADSRRRTWLHRGEPEAGTSLVVTLWTRALPPTAQSQGTVVASGHLCLASPYSFTSCRLSEPDKSAMEKMPFQ